MQDIQRELQALRAISLGVIAVTVSVLRVASSSVSSAGRPRRLASGSPVQPTEALREE